MTTFVPNFSNISFVVSGFTDLAGNIGANVNMTTDGSYVNFNAAPLAVFLAAVGTVNPFTGSTVFLSVGGLT